MTPEPERYRLYYWPTLPGRGELVRLIFEDAGVPYLDVARLPAEAGGGVARILELRRGEAPGLLPYAPPILEVGDLVLSQTAVICDFLARRFGLVPEDEASRLAALQLQLTLLDVVAEAHDTHHPISTAKYYEEQRDAAKDAARAFIATRLPSWLAYFERVAERAGGAFLLGAEASYVDLALFQVVEGLRHAFPQAMARQSCPRVFAIAAAVSQRPGIARYLASERRLPFNEQGIFRYYAELDSAE